MNNQPEDFFKGGGVPAMTDPQGPTPEPSLTPHEALEQAVMLGGMEMLSSGCLSIEKNRDIVDLLKNQIEFSTRAPLTLTNAQAKKALEILLNENDQYDMVTVKMMFRAAIPGVVFESDGKAEGGT